MKWFVAALLVALLLAAALWTPDLPRAELEAKYSRGPADFRVVAGLRWHLRVSGPAAAPPIVLLHGLGASLHTWDAWAERLPDYRVIRFDLPGFGLTGPDPSGDYSDARATTLLLALLDSLGVQQAIIVGHSLGGRLAWTFAAEHPERVSRLVLISPDGFASPGFEYDKAADVPALMELMRFALPRSLLRMNIVPGYGRPELVADALVTRYYDLMRAPGVRAAILARLGQTRLRDPRPMLARIEAPTLLIWGEHDRMIPFANSADYLAAIPASKRVALSGIGHLAQEEAPDDTVKAVREFLASAPGQLAAG